MFQDFRFSPGDAIRVDPAFIAEQNESVARNLKGKGEVVALTLDKKGTHVSVKFGEYRTVLSQHVIFGA